VQSNQLGARSGIKVAMDGIAHLCPQLVHGLCLRENRLSDSPRREATLGCVLNDENDLAHMMSSNGAEALEMKGF
jgi:hypothetical protein